MLTSMKTKGLHHYLRLIAVVLMICLAITLFPHPISYAEGEKTVMPMTSFETQEDLLKVNYYGMFESYFSLNTDPEFVTEGKSSLKCIINGNSTFLPTIPKPALKFFNTAYTGYYEASINIKNYSTFEFDIFNYGYSDLSFNVNIVDFRNAKTNDYFTVKRGQSMHVVVEISEEKLNFASNNGFSEFTYIAITFEHPKQGESPKKFCIDNLYLTK